MDKDVKAKWVAALRSGEYKQAKDQLRLNDSFCCLGVLCDLIDPSKWKGQFWDESLSVLPFALNSELDISTSDESTVANMNDDGKTFAEIADWIEANL